MKAHTFWFWVLGGAALGVAPATGHDQPQWGHAWTRNMVSDEHGLPDSFDPTTGRNIKWIAKLGTESHSTPVVAGGRVYVGTNNGDPRDPRHQGDRGVLMCFDERSGMLLWQLVVPKREEDPYFDWPRCGISSSVTVEGDRVYLVNNRGEAMCLDARGLANGNDGPFRDETAHLIPIATNRAERADSSGPLGSPGNPPERRAGETGLGPLDADVLWLFDLTSGAGIWSHDAAHSSILIRGDVLYLNTGTGVDNTHKRIRTPDAPSLVALDKATGRLLARDDEQIAPRIFHCTWSAPSMAMVQGRDLIFFAGGDGVIYAFEPYAQIVEAFNRSSAQTADPSAGSASTIQPFKPSTSTVASLRKVWQFDCDPLAPKENVHRYNSNRSEGPSNIYGMPVFHQGRIYVAGGGDWFWGKNDAWLKCFEATGAGDLTSSALRWSYSLGRHTMCTPAIANGVVYATDYLRTLHCVDASTGRSLWTHELNGEIWASALVADGKVYIGTRRGDFCVFAAGREKRLISTVRFGAPISATATAANGVLYVATMTHLHALAQPGP